MSETFDFDFEPNLTLMRLAWKAGLAIGNEAGKAFDNRSSSSGKCPSQRPNIDYNRLKKPLFDYENL